MNPETLAKIRVVAKVVQDWLWAHPCALWIALAFVVGLALG